jgi:ketosteroid isomerase-like protein
MSMAQTERGEIMSVEENKKVVLQFIEYITAQDYAKLADLFAEDFQWIIPVRSEAMKAVVTHRDKAYSVERMKANRVLMKGGMKFTPFAWTAEGDRVAVECEGQVVWNNDKTYNNLYHLAFVIRDGRIKSLTEYCDYLYAYETNPLHVPSSKKG